MLQSRFIGGPPFGVRLFWQNQSITQLKEGPIFLKPNLDKSDVRLINKKCFFTILNLKILYHLFWEHLHKIQQAHH
jgi:hypothetical protein